MWQSFRRNRQHSESTWCEHPIIVRGMVWIYTVPVFCHRWRLCHEYHSDGDHIIWNRSMSIFKREQVSGCEVGILSDNVQATFHQWGMPSKVLSEQCHGWIDLRQALQLAAWESGNPIISNGNRVSTQCDSNNRVFRCGISHRGYRPSTCIDTTDEISYRCSTLINDRANNRKNGKNLPKRIKVVDKSGPSC